MKMHKKRWCSTDLSKTKHDIIINETKEIFHLVTNRIGLENEQLFPILAIA